MAYGEQGEGGGETAALEALAERAVERQRRLHALERDRHREVVRQLTESSPELAGKLRAISGALAGRPSAEVVHPVLDAASAAHTLGLLHTLEGSFPTQLSVKGAPYDFEWTARKDFGSPMADRTLGTMELAVSSGSVPGDSESETTWNGAAIGVRFRPRPGGSPFVRVAPFLPFGFRWSDDSTLEVARNRGELGVLVREGANGRIVVDRRVPLWNDGTGWYQTHSDERDDTFTDSTFFLAAPEVEHSIWFWFNSSIDFNKTTGAFDFGSSRASNSLGARLGWVVIEH